MPDRLPTLEEVRQNRAGLNVCVVCKSDIHIMCRKYTGICSENCDKAQTTVKTSLPFPASETHISEETPNA